MDKKEIFKVIENLTSTSNIQIPKFKSPSIPKEGLIPSNIITFENGERYDSEKNIFYLKNDETFEGKIEKSDEKYKLVNGLYKWPSGQSFNGKFINNKFEGELRFGKNYIYNGIFNNSNFDGKGKFNWDEKNYISGNFQQGKINGKGIISKENYFIEGNFVDSKPEGEILSFNIFLDNHKYEFPKFHLDGGYIEENNLIIKKIKHNMKNKTKKLK